MASETLSSAPYSIEEPAQVLTPAVAVYPQLIQANIQTAVRIAADPGRLRPHVKTHKTRELTELELRAGITKHKCATIAEAELLAQSGVRDIVIAYTLVGPNVGRFVQLQAQYPACVFRPLVDHPRPANELAMVMAAQGKTAEVLLDMDVGMGRTGIALGPEAVRLYGTIHGTPGLAVGGLHIYDGQNHQQDSGERARAVDEIWRQVRGLVAQLESAGWPVPRLVCGNTPTFPCWACWAREEPRIECSPGTLVLNDWNYYRNFEDVPCRPAACLLTRVISRPKPGRLTLDLGYKAVACDSPLEARVRFLDLADAKAVMHNEEHLVIQTASADRFSPGDLLYAWPAHICPTCALHRDLLVVENGRVTGTWAVAARDRQLRC